METKLSRIHNFVLIIVSNIWYQIKNIKNINLNLFNMFKDILLNFMLLLLHIEMVIEKLFI